MALKDVQRATIDLHFILMLEDWEKADSLFESAEYTRVFKSENAHPLHAPKPRTLTH
jgi:hypothetical protein